MHLPVYFLQLFTLKKQNCSVLHHQPPPVPVTEEAGLFKSRKDVCDGAGPLSLLFFKPPAGMWICQDDRQLSTYLSSIPPSHFCLSLTPLLYPLTVGRDLGIPAVTQELPPLLSAFFSSRSESWTSLGPDPNGQGGLLYGLDCL